MRILGKRSKRGVTKGTSGQSSVEFLIIGVVGFMMMSAVAYIIYAQFGDQIGDVNVAQLQKFGNTIVSTASKISYYGDTTVMTVEPSLPSGVDRIWVDENDRKTLILSYIDEGRLINVTFSSSVPLVVDVWSYRQGRKTIIIKSKGDYTLVCEKSLNRCNDYCDYGQGETADNSPNDCCTPECYGCGEDGVFTSCTNDGACHPSCVGHNGCTECP